MNMSAETIARRALPLLTLVSLGASACSSPNDSETEGLTRPQVTTSTTAPDTFCDELSELRVDLGYEPQAIDIDTSRTDATELGATIVEGSPDPRSASASYVASVVGHVLNDIEGANGDFAGAILTNLGKARTSVSNAFDTHCTTN